MLFSPKKTAKEHMSLLTSITVKVEHNESHAPAAAVSLTDKVVRTCSSALLRQLVNTKVSQFICHVMGCRLTRALHAAWLVCICGVYIWFICGGPPQYQHCQPHTHFLFLEHSSPIPILSLSVSQTQNLQPSRYSVTQDKKHFGSIN